MSKKQRKAQTEPGSDELRTTVPKPLVITPQIPVAIHGEFPNQYLTVEQPNQSASRKKVQLTPDNAYAVIFAILQEKAAEIELEREQQESARNKTRKHSQPNWRLIAKHPQAEIREGLTPAHLCAKGSITVLPTKSSQLMSDKSDKTLDEMGL